MKVKFLGKSLAPLWSGLACKGGRSEALLKLKGRHLFADVFAVPCGENAVALLRLKAVRACQDKMSLERTIKVVPLVAICK